MSLADQLSRVKSIGRLALNTLAGPAPLIWPLLLRRLLFREAGARRQPHGLHRSPLLLEVVATTGQIGGVSVDLPAIPVLRPGAGRNTLSSCPGSPPLECLIAAVLPLAGCDGLEGVPVPPVAGKGPETPSQPPAFP